MATLERQHNSTKKRAEGDVALQIEALRNRLSSLDSELKESEQDTERMLQDLEERRNLELHLIKDLGGVADDGLGNGLVGISRNGGAEEGSSQKSSLGGSLRGSLSSIPSIVISSTEKKTPDKIFGFKKNHEGCLYVSWYVKRTWIGSIFGVDPPSRVATQRSSDKVGQTITANPCSSRGTSF
ncbi:hypothetical protein SK128_008761 [Halocaridina rubra]|uniref:Uncharacterized protein n=1 Tax=Halocaridina rubra TaxID=373956 RepID=A0AAN8XIL2_HALRR